MFRVNKTFPFTKNCKCGEYYTVPLPLHECRKLSFSVIFGRYLYWFITDFANVSSDLLKADYECLMVIKQNYLNFQIDLPCVIFKLTL